MIKYCVMLGVPVLLFMVKYIIPPLAESAYSEKATERAQTIIELIHFPVDLFFISTSYSIPKVIEYLVKLGKGVDLLHNEVLSLINASIISGVSLFLVVFAVLVSKIAEKQYHAKKWKEFYIRISIEYLIALAFVVWSISLF